MKISTSIKGLSISINSDGVWLNTDASTGKHASFNLVNYANNRSGIHARAVLDWCIEVRELYSKKETLI